MKKTNLAKAVAIAATGAVLSLGVSSVASAKVMYNTAHFPEGMTDGWTLSGGKSKIGTPVPWKGTEGGVRPFGFVGTQALSWAAAIHDSGSVLKVSQADSVANYGFEAELDTANGAWGAWPIEEGGTSLQGWGHNVDFGLIKSDIDTNIRIDLAKVDPMGAGDNFGITVFTGMDDGTNYDAGNRDKPGFSHHAPWNSGYISGVLEVGAKVDDPFGTHGVKYLTHGDQSTVTFHAVAGQVYSVYLGGNEVNGEHFGKSYGYEATISAVPVPAAAWLFGSGLIGLVSLGRRKQEVV